MGQGRIAASPGPVSIAPLWQATASTAAPLGRLRASRAAPPVRAHRRRGRVSPPWLRIATKRILGGWEKGPSHSVRAGFVGLYIMRSSALRVPVDIEFVDPAEAPLPPDEMSFRSVAVEPYPDGRRVGVRLAITPFQVRPSIDLEVLDAEGVKLASSSIIEATDVEMSVTLHLRQHAADRQLRLAAQMYYPDHGQVDQHHQQFSFPAQHRS